MKKQRSQSNVVAQTLGFDVDYIPKIVETASKKQREKSQLKDSNNRPVLNINKLGLGDGSDFEEYIAICSGKACKL